ncbi:MBL fold metallo-hydrolase [Deinococcus sp.]|uniref:MBL fold metallo-hydrolase n=1 Tax=Deinococcus sp. TaxID=47478 RepID=UPI003CC644A8
MGTALGLDLGRLEQNLRLTGIDPASITDVILSHAHLDHVGGVTRLDGTLVYPDAQYHMAAHEWSSGPHPDLRVLPVNDGLRQTFVTTAQRSLGAVHDRVNFVQAGREIMPGIQAVEAAGHMPGHTALLITAGKSKLLHVVDVFHHAAFDLAHPTWQTAFDHDPPGAYATRRRLLDQVCVDRTAVLAYHAPFPGLGHVLVNGPRYDWVAAPWQFEVQPHPPALGPADAVRSALWRPGQWTESPLSAGRPASTRPWPHRSAALRYPELRC